jgi:hypothetical protein
VILGRKKSSGKALIAVTIFTNNKINKAATANFNKHNHQLFNGFGIIPAVIVLRA